jgi:hypothetical protein
MPTFQPGVDLACKQGISICGEIWRSWYHMSFYYIYLFSDTLKVPLFPYQKPATILQFCQNHFLMTSRNQCKT